MRAALTPAGGTRAWRRLVDATLARDGYTCQMTVAMPGQPPGRVCGRPATTADHIIPRALGGGDELANLQAACVPCNLAAGAKLRGRAGADLVRSHNAITALVAALDSCGVPVGAGRREALAALAARNAHPYRRADVDAAVRFRRHRGPLTRV